MSQATIRPAPVRKTLSVKAPPDRAFRIFTAEMGRWWPKTHSIGTAPMQQVVVEAHAGGRWYERGTDGSECDWGRVLVWEPPSRLVLAWQIDGTFKFAPDLVTEVELRFIADAGGTRVEFEHRNLERFADHAETMRNSVDGGWSLVLAPFVALASES